MEDESESRLYKEAQAAAQAVIAAGGDASMLAPFLKNVRASPPCRDMQQHSRSHKRKYASE